MAVYESDPLVSAINSMFGVKRFREVRYFVFPFQSYDVFVLYVDYALSGTIYFQSGRPMPNRLFNRIQSNTPCNFFLYGKLFSLVVGILAGTVAYRTPGRKDLTKVDRHFSEWHFIVSNCYKNLASWLLAITYYLMYMYEPLFYSKFSLNWL